MLLLGFDTATPRVTVALHDGREVVASYASDPSSAALRHGEMLAPGIEAVLAEAGTTAAALTDIVVGVGPGPFTGLRVGLVTARTMGLALGVPVRGVCTLDVLAAEAVSAGNDDFVVATDARRKEVYLASYADGVRAADPQVARPDAVATDLPAAGRGPVLYPEAFPHAIEPLDPSAAYLCEAVVGGAFPLLEPEPLYLRRPDAAVPAQPKRVS